MAKRKRPADTKEPTWEQREANDAKWAQIVFDDEARRTLQPILAKFGVGSVDVMNVRSGGDIFDIVGRLKANGLSSEDLKQLSRDLNPIFNGQTSRIQRQRAVISRLAGMAAAQPLRFRQFKGLSEAQRVADEGLGNAVTALCLSRMINSLYPQFMNAYELFRQPEEDWVLGRWLVDEQPTYFVDGKLFDSVVNTEPPEGHFSLGELEWPMDVFALLLDGTHTMGWDEGGESKTTNIFGYMLARCDGEPVLSPESCFGVAVEPPIFDAEFTAPRALVNGRAGDIRIVLLTEEADLHIYAEEQILDRQLRGILYALLYAMTERPQLIERGGFTKEIRSKGRRVKEWTPNYIGRAYRTLTVKAKDSHDASDRSVRSHWRMGHWRNQAFGSRSGVRKHKRIWIDRVWVVGVEAHE